MAEEKIRFFSVVFLFAIALKLSGLKFRRSEKSDACDVSGFMGTAVGVGGPPITLLYHDISGPVLRATCTIFLNRNSNIITASRNRKLDPEIFLSASFSSSCYWEWLFLDL